RRAESRHRHPRLTRDEQWPGSPAHSKGRRAEQAIPPHDVQTRRKAEAALRQPRPDWVRTVTRPAPEGTAAYSYFPSARRIPSDMPGTYVMSRTATAMISRNGKAVRVTTVSGRPNREDER